MSSAPQCNGRSLVNIIRVVFVLILLTDTKPGVTVCIEATLHDFNWWVHGTDTFHISDQLNEHEHVQTTPDSLGFCFWWPAAPPHTNQSNHLLFGAKAPALVRNVRGLNDMKEGWYGDQTSWWMISWSLLKWSYDVWPELCFTWVVPGNWL